MAAIRREFIALYSLVVFLTLVVGVMGGYLFFSARAQAPRGTALVGPTAPPALGGGPELPPRGLELARGWMCMCGTCSDELLACHCDDPNGAHEIKGAIRDALDAGMSDEEVRTTLVERYGPRLLGGQAPRGTSAGREVPAATGAAEQGG